MNTGAFQKSRAFACRTDLESLLPITATFWGYRMNSITPTLRALCGRLAVERLRREQWTLAADLRRQVIARLKHGETADAITAELQMQIAQAAGESASFVAVPTRKARRAHEGPADSGTESPPCTRR